MFADSSFAVLVDLIVQEVSGRTSLPSWGATALQPGIVWMARLTKGIDVTEVRPADAAGEYRYPLGLAHCDEDERIPLKGHLTEIRAAVQAPPRMTIYENCGHSDAWDDYPGHYGAYVLDYFDERLGL